MYLSNICLKLSPMEKNIYEIKVVSNQTGLSPFTIRAWENRYKVVNPDRTESNRRLYSDDDIKKLKLLNLVVKAGHSIGNVAGLNTGDLLLLIEKAGVKEIDENRSTLPDYNADLTTEIELAKKAIQKLDSSLLEELLLKNSVNYSQPVVIKNFLIPLLIEIGSSWQGGSLRIAHEHLATQVIRNFLMNVISGYRFEENAPTAIIATPCGQRHELGALIGAVIMASQGWKPIYLGPDLPAAEISYSSNVIKPKVVYLSIIYAGDPKLTEEIAQIRFLLSEDVRLILSGNDLSKIEENIKKTGALIVNTPDELKQQLAII